MLNQARVWLNNLLSLEFPVSDDKDAFCPPGPGRIPSHGMIYLPPAFRGTEESQIIILAAAVSEVTLIQANRYAKVLYFGVANCAPPPWHAGRW